jgi:hypothetical protein
MNYHHLNRKLEFAVITSHNKYKLNIVQPLAVSSSCCCGYAVTIHQQEVYMSYAFLKPVLMAIHRRLIKKGLYFEAANLMAYMWGIHTIYTKASVRFWLANYKRLGW